MRRQAGTSGIGSPSIGEPAASGHRGSAIVGGAIERTGSGPFRGDVARPSLGSLAGNAEAFGGSEQCHPNGIPATTGAIAIRPRGRIGRAIGRNDRATSAERAIATALLERGCGGELSLPVLGRDVPTSIDPGDGVGTEASVAAIAEALLNAGILAEDGWLGSIAETVTAGLRGWSASLGAEELHFFRCLMLVWGDSCANVQLEAHMSDLYDAEDKVGFFGLSVGEAGSDCFCLEIGLGIETLMSVVGRATAWRVCRVLQSSLSSVGIGTVPAGMREWCESNDYDTDADEAEKHDILTSKRFDAGQPWQACQYARASDPRLLRRAVGDIRRNQSRNPDLRIRVMTDGRQSDAAARQAAWALEIVRLTAELGTLLDRSYRGSTREKRSDYDLNQLNEFYPSATLPPLCLCWSHYDSIPRVWDDYAQDIGCGDMTPIVTLIAFKENAADPNKPGGLGFAAQRLTDLVKIVVRCERILTLLETTDEGLNDCKGVWPPGTSPRSHPPEPVKVEKSDRLIDIFAPKVEAEAGNREEANLCTL